MENHLETIKNRQNRTITVLIKTELIRMHLCRDRNKVPRLDPISNVRPLDLTYRPRKEIRAKMIVKKPRYKCLSSNLLIMVHTNKNLQSNLPTSRPVYLQGATMLPRRRRVKERIKRLQQDITYQVSQSSHRGHPFYLRIIYVFHFVDPGFL